MEKAGPFNANVLSSLLSILAGQDRIGDTGQDRTSDTGQDRTGDIPSSSQVERARSPTRSLHLESNIGFETFCHDELVQAGGRPAISLELLLSTLKDVNAGREKLELWLGGTDSSRQDGDVPPAFSAQLEDWETFQHKWQWDNRGRYAGDEGFAAFLESRRKRYLYKGESGVVLDHSFEETARRIWEYEQRYLEASGTEGFVAYTQAVERRLTSHHFTQPFQLAEDPRQQDARTTWVEYLSYVYWWRDRHAAAMEAAEPQYRQAWHELQHFDTSPLSTTSTTAGALDEELGAARAQLETTMQQIRKFIKGTNAYRREEKAVHRQELRAQWALEQLTLLNTVSSPDRVSTRKSLGANSSKKRKATDDHDILPRPQRKRRRPEVDHDGSVPDPKPEAGRGSETVMPDSTAATSKAASSGPRRSRRLQAAVAAAKAPSSKPQSKGQGVRNKQRQGKTQEKLLGSVTSQKSQGRKKKSKK